MMPGATKVGTSAFATAIIENMNSQPSPDNAFVSSSFCYAVIPGLPAQAGESEESLCDPCSGKRRPSTQA